MLLGRGTTGIAVAAAVDVGRSVEIANKVGLGVSEAVGMIFGVGVDVDGRGVDAAVQDAKKSAVRRRTNENFGCMK